MYEDGEICVCIYIIGKRKVEMELYSQPWGLVRSLGEASVWILEEKKGTALLSYL